MNLTLYGCQNGSTDPSEEMRARVDSFLCIPSSCFEGLPGNVCTSHHHFFTAIISGCFLRDLPTEDMVCPSDSVGIDA